MLKRLFVLVFVVGSISGCVNRDEIYANPPHALIEHIDQILPAAEQFALKNESEALESGKPLTEEQLFMASQIGLKDPKSVRVYYVDELPFPDDPELVSLAKKFGYSSPYMDAYTYGYGIWIKRSSIRDRELLAHELIHVRQAEQMGVREQIKQYLMQLYIYGYQNAPLELEAYREATIYQ